MRLVPILLLLLPTAARADEVFLKGAGSISGRIVEQTASTISIDIGGGVMGVPMSHVDRIVKARSPLDDYDDRARRLAPGDASGWRDLGRWAAQQGLSKQSEEAYQKVLAIAPDDAEAREALGFVRFEGRWVTEEDSYRARGYVKYENEWMLPAEANMRQQHAAAEQARVDSEQAARDAETAKMLAENRAAKAAEKAADERAREMDEARWGQPVYWGGWGYGVTTWPSPNTVTRQPGSLVP